MNVLKDKTGLRELRKKEGRRKRRIKERKEGWKERKKRCGNYIEHLEIKAIKSGIKKLNRLSFPILFPFLLAQPSNSTLIFFSISKLSLPNKEYLQKLPLNVILTIKTFPFLIRIMTRMPTFSAFYWISSQYQRKLTIDRIQGKKLKYHYFHKIWMLWKFNRTVDNF